MSRRRGLRGPSTKIQGSEVVAVSVFSLVRNPSHQPSEHWHSVWRIEGLACDEENVCLRSVDTCQIVDWLKFLTETLRVHQD